jgi:hypothetical protein
MVKGSILSTTIVSPINTSTNSVAWDTELRLGAGAFSYLDPVTDNTRLILPADLAAQRFELFMWLEQGADLGANDAYVGLNGPGAYWYGIVRKVGRASRGFRSGLLPYQNYVGGAGWIAQSRTFGGSGTWQLANTRLGILVDPIPIAVCSTSVNSNSTATKLNLWRTIPLTYSFNPQGIASGTTVTAPSGASAVVASINARVITNSTADHWFALYKNGSAIRTYYHGDSAVGPAPGTFGIQECSAGDTFYLSSYVGAQHTYSKLSASFEFY